MLFLPCRVAHLGCPGSALLSYYLWEPALWDATQARIPIEFWRGPAPMAASVNVLTHVCLPAGEQVYWLTVTFARFLWPRLEDRCTPAGRPTRVLGWGTWWNVVCLHEHEGSINSLSPSGIPRKDMIDCHCCRQSANLFTGTHDTELYPAREGLRDYIVSGEALFPQSTLICSGCPELRP